MFFTRWFPTQKLAKPTYRPMVMELEDRTVPSNWWDMFLPPAGTTDHFQVLMPPQVRADTPAPVLVIARDANNFFTPGYVGTAHFSLGTPDSGAKLPDDYTFKPQDHGVHWFSVTLSATGSQTINVNDTADASIKGSATTNVNPAPVATHFLMWTKGHATVGLPATVVIVAADASNHPVPNYTGTVTFSSSDPAATFPSTLTFGTGDHGFRFVQATFNTPGAQTLDATDGTISGQAKVTVDAPAVVTHFAIWAGKALPGLPTPFVVVALDANNHVVPTYTGTVHFTSTDGNATLPKEYTFTAADHGFHLFTATFSATGSQSIKASDDLAAITGSVTINVWTLPWWHN